MVDILYFVVFIGCWVVVVEDEVLICFDLVEMLCEEGFDVVGEVGDGEWVVELVCEYVFDLVIFDVKMLVFDGLLVVE